MTAATLLALVARLAAIAVVVGAIIAKMRSLRGRGTRDAGRGTGKEKRDGN